METPDELRVFLLDATQDGIWNRLLYRGAAWALMREEGQLPADAPALGATIDTDLAEHGFSVLRAALALRQAEGSSELCSRGFERAGNAFESLVRNEDPTAPERGFYRTIAAASYHLAGFSAVAYSLFGQTTEGLNMVDRADAAALSGDVDELAEALTGLAQRLLVIRPFIPDPANRLPPHWPQLLKQWVSGAEVSVIGPQNMRVVEDAFTYRLVWALEALRTRRLSLGWSPDIVAGGGAAALETGVPQFMMSMLIRAGLPSRRAAIAAIASSGALFVSPGEMRTWLASNEIAAFTDQGDWPTPGSAALWRRFRDEMLGGIAQTWNAQGWTRAFQILEGDAPPAGLYRIEKDELAGETWLATPDYRRTARFKKSIDDRSPSLLLGRLKANETVAAIERMGRGKAKWPRADA